jgi:excisionase family DNA binding protein
MLNPQPVIPSKKEVALAEASMKVLASYIEYNKTPLTLQLVKEGRAKTQITLPPSALKLLLDILGQISEGNAIAVLPVHAELTTQEAADLLNISRPYLVQLLEKHKLPFRKVGSKRRLLIKDVLQYKADIDQARLKVLRELTEQAQKLNIGY